MWLTQQRHRDDPPLMMSAPFLFFRFLLNLIFFFFPSCLLFLLLSTVNPFSLILTAIMSTVQHFERKHKITVVGSGNW